MNDSDTYKIDEVFFHFDLPTSYRIDTITCLCANATEPLIIILNIVSKKEDNNK